MEVEVERRVLRLIDSMSDTGSLFEPSSHLLQKSVLVVLHYTTLQYDDGRVRRLKAG